MTYKIIDKDTTAAFFKTLQKYKDILILIKGSPDPDAIAVSFAIGQLCDILGIHAVIVSTAEISLSQNRELIRALNIPVHFVNSIKNIGKYAAYIVCDHQSAYVKGISEKLPCAVHLDHHTEIEDTVEAEFTLINTSAGSASSMMALILQMELIELPPEIITAMATALLYGIETDTDHYTHADKLDYEAIDYLTKYADKKILHKISSIPVSQETLSMINIALQKKVIYKEWFIAGVGYVDKAHRDSIAITADFVLQKMKPQAAVIFALIEDKENNRLVLDASFRSLKETLNLDDIIKGITSNGGGRRYKGAYQISLDYFFYCPDKIKFWEVINQTTLEILKKSRDTVYITEFKGFFTKLKQKFKNLFD